MQNLAPLFDKLPNKFQPLAEPTKPGPRTINAIDTRDTGRPEPAAPPAPPATANPNVIGKVVTLDLPTATGFVSNLGRGVAVGQQLVVVKEIKDPDSGEVLGYDTQKDANVIEITELNGNLVKVKVVSVKVKDLVKIKTSN